MIGVFDDLKFATRVLRRSPGFTVAVLSTLALGIGANVAVFSLVDGVLLRPLPLPESDRLYLLWQGRDDGGSFWLSAPNYRDVRDRIQAFSGVAAFSPERFISAGGDEPERVAGATVTPDFFDVLGVDAVLGRTFGASDDRQAVAVIDAGFWQRQLGGSPEAIGSTVRIDDSPVEIIGVVPAGPLLPSEAEVWVPINLVQPEWRQRRGIGWIQVVARLSPGATVASASAELRQLSAELAVEFPDSNADTIFVPESLRANLVEGARVPLVAMMVTVGLVLLIVCINVAGLLMARAQDRRREVAIRFALGSGRARLLRQFLCESAVIAGFGGVLGFVVGYAAVRMLVATAPPETPRVAGVGIDATALIFCVAVTLGSGLAFGLVPALQAARLETRGIGSDLVRRLSGRPSVRSGLVAAQVAVAVILTIAASLLLKSFWLVSKVDPGFDTADLLTVGLPLLESRFANNQARMQHVQRMRNEVDALPGVASTAYVDSLPLRDFGRTFSFELRQPPDPEAELLAGFRVVTPGYFDTMGIDVLDGRPFLPSDDAAAESVAIVDETLVRRYFGGRSAVGQEIRLLDEWRRIVGVVAAIRDRSLAGRASDRMYVPLAQSGATRSAVVLVVRVGSPGVRGGRGVGSAAGASGDPLELLPSVRAAVRRIDPEQVLSFPMSMEGWVQRSLSTSRFTTIVLAFFGCSALLLAAVGLYGVLAYAVRRRTHEIGIRMAVGAAADEVRRLIVRQGLLLTTIGLAVGLAIALAGSRLLESLLYEVSARDPLVFGGVASLLAIVALLASWLPASRATRIDPVEVLRLD